MRRSPRFARRLGLPVLTLLAACSQPAEQGAAQTPPPPLPDAPLAAPNRAPPPDLATLKMSFAPVVKRAAPAVVNVYSTRTVRTQVDPFWSLFGGASVPQSRVEGSLGSGVIVRADGVIVTNNHVVEGGQQLRVVLADRREFPAKVLLADARSDLAVLKIDVGAERLPVLPIGDRDDVQVGDLVLAIGNPFGVGQTVTNGIVSGLARTEVGASDSGFFLQTDAAINPGNSGGPLVDMDANLIGINSSILTRSGSSSGVGFAIPAALVRRVVESAVGGVHTVQRAWLGVRATAVDAETARSLGLDRPQGVLIAQINPQAAGARAGLQVGDLLLSVDGQPVSDQASLNYLVSTRRPGDVVTLLMRRGSAAPRALRASLGTLPASPPRDERTFSGREPLQGATAVNLSPATADQYGLDPFATGVLIISAGEGFAGRVFQPGDIILSVNGRPVTSTAALASALGAAQGWRIVLQRGDQQAVVEF